MGFKLSNRTEEKIITLYIFILLFSSNVLYQHHINLKNENNTQIFYSSFGTIDTAAKNPKMYSLSYKKCEHTVRPSSSSYT